MKKGIDVSSYQNKIDWNKVKSFGVQFAILKIIRKDLSLDKQFINNVTGCIENKIPFNVYNYSYALTREKAKSDAKLIVQILNSIIPKNNNLFEGYIWMDVENKSQLGLGHLLIDIVKEYESVIEGAGYKFGIYTGLSFYNTEFKKYANELDCPFWIARYPSSSKMIFTQNPNEQKKPSIKNELWGWQYTSKGTVPGINGNVDLNLCYDEEKSVSEKIGVQQFSLLKNGSQQISPNFKIREFRCKDGSDKILIDVDFVKEKLQLIRNHFGAPVTINSAYRTTSYNAKVGGAKGSFHLKGQAFDIVVKGVSPQEVAKYAQSIGINGIIQYNTFVHVDNRPSKYWARNNNGSIKIVNNF